MKRKVLILTVILVFVIALSTVVFATDVVSDIKALFFASDTPDKANSEVVATVDGENIYRHQIDSKIEFNKLQIANLPQEYKNTIPAITEQEALESIIQNKVILKYASDMGLTVDKNEARNYIVNNYNQIIILNDENAAFIKEYLKETGFSEEAYLDIATEAYCEMLLRDKVYENFCEGKEFGEEKLKEEYEKFVDSLVEKAEIVLK